MWVERPSQAGTLSYPSQGSSSCLLSDLHISTNSRLSTLVAELTKRFTPVHIPAIQMSVFHDRQQKAKESVDSSAQDLRKLFIKAYPMSQQGSKEAEEMGKTVLANQFVVGLIPELKRKVAGTEGNFEQLLTKAHFEEAKLREVTVKIKSASQSQSLLRK